jgi:hypothetical protein
VNATEIVLRSQRHRAKWPGAHEGPLFQIAAVTLGAMLLVGLVA